MTSTGKRAADGLIFVSVLFLLTLLTSLTNANEFPPCTCSGQNCTISTDGGGNGSEMTSPQPCTTPAYMCCNKSLETKITYSGCTTPLDCEMGNITCLQLVGCLNICLVSGQTNCSTNSTSNTTSTNSKTSTDTATMSCPKYLKFPFYESNSKGKCVPNTNFWLLVTIAPGVVILILLIVLTVVLCRKYRTRTPEHNTGPPGKEDLEKKLPSTKKQKGPQRVPTKPNDYTPKQTNQGPQVESVPDYDVVTPRPQVDETQEDYVNVPQGLVPPNALVPPNDSEQEVYENYELSLINPDDQEIYANDEAIGNNQSAAGNRESQGLYLPMDVSTVQPLHEGYANMSGKNANKSDVVSQLQRLVTMHGKPHVAEREDSQDDYMYADQACGHATLLPQPQPTEDPSSQETYADIPQGNDDDDQSIYVNLPAKSS